MARETDTTRLPDAGEDRIIECPVCAGFWLDADELAIIAFRM